MDKLRETQFYTICTIHLFYLDSSMQKNETRPTIYIIHKNKFKMDKRLKCKSWQHKRPRENIGRKISDIQCRSIFTAISPRAWDIKERINNGTSSKYKASAQLENTALNERRTSGMGKHTLTFTREQSGAVHCPPLHQEAHNIGIFLFVFLWLICAFNCVQTRLSIIMLLQIFYLLDLVSATKAEKVYWCDRLHW